MAIGLRGTGPASARSSASRRRDDRARGPARTPRIGRERGGALGVRGRVFDLVRRPVAIARAFRRGNEQQRGRARRGNPLRSCSPPDRPRGRPLRPRARRGEALDRLQRPPRQPPHRARGDGGAPRGPRRGRGAFSGRRLPRRLLARARRHPGGAAHRRARDFPRVARAHGDDPGQPRPGHRGRRDARARSPPRGEPGDDRDRLLARRVERRAVAPLPPRPRDLARRGEPRRDAPRRSLDLRDHVPRGRSRGEHERDVPGARRRRPGRLPARVLRRGRRRRGRGRRRGRYEFASSVHGALSQAAHGSGDEDHVRRVPVPGEPRRGRPDEGADRSRRGGGVAGRRGRGGVRRGRQRVVDETEATLPRRRPGDHGRSPGRDADPGPRASALRRARGGREGAPRRARGRRRALDAAAFGGGAPGRRWRRGVRGDRARAPPASASR